MDSEKIDTEHDAKEKEEKKLALLANKDLSEDDKKRLRKEKKDAAKSAKKKVN